MVSPAVDPSTTTVEVWVKLANPGERLKPGGTVHVSIIADTIQNAIVVPASALLYSDTGGAKVMAISSDNTAHERMISVGIRQGDRVQILGGLAQGDRVVVSGTFLVDSESRLRSLVSVPSAAGTSGAKSDHMHDHTTEAQPGAGHAQ